MDIDAIKKGLTNLKQTKPEKEKKTRKEIIKELYKDIKELRKEGHSFEDILKVLEKGGVIIKESTLKKYMTNLTNKKRKIAKDNNANSSVKASKALVSSPSQNLPTPQTKSVPEEEKKKEPIWCQGQQKSASPDVKRNLLTGEPRPTPCP